MFRAGLLFGHKWQDHGKLCQGQEELGRELGISRKPGWTLTDQWIIRRGFGKLELESCHAACLPPPNSD